MKIRKLRHREGEQVAKVTPGWKTWGLRFKVWFNLFKSADLIQVKFSEVYLSARQEQVQVRPTWPPTC